MGGHEPTERQCQKAADRAIEEGRKELDARKINWDLLAGKIEEELDYEEPVVVKQVRLVTVGKGKKKGKRVVSFHRKIMLRTPAAMAIRQKGRISTHELRGDFPPKETRLAGPGGGPIPLQRLTVEFVKPGQVRNKTKER